MSTLAAVLLGSPSARGEGAFLLITYLAVARTVELPPEIEERFLARAGAIPVEARFAAVNDVHSGPTAFHLR